MATSRVARCGELLASAAERLTVTRRMDECFLTLRLPAGLGDDFLRAVRVRWDVLRSKVKEVPEDQPWPEASAPASLRVTRTFSTRGWRPPLWVGLLGLLEDFVALHDPTEAGVGGRAREELFARSGYRCSAPGCTGRELLQIHHLKFRSAGGGEELWNKESLCLFHHQIGIHRGLAAARGNAPLGVTWRLGRDELSEWFRNERRIAGEG